jgi:hypothetical protein
VYVFVVPPMVMFTLMLAGEDDGGRRNTGNYSVIITGSVINC